MSEKKNIVIKVKYPSGANTKAKSKTQPGTVTHWNLKRIGLALGSLLLLMISFFYFTDTDKQDIETEKPLALPKQVTPAVKTENTQLSLPEKPLSSFASSVIRAQLTSDVKKNEPIDSINAPVKIDRKEKKSLYFFAELKGLKGKTIFHEWLLNDQLVSQKKVNISSDPWRTASRQTITYTMDNDWAVRIVDDNGNKVTEIKFNLELK
jgi:hypothetical protein